MPIDPNIILGGKSVEIQNPMNALAQMLQVKQAQQQIGQNEFAMEDKRRTIEETNRLRQLMQGVNISTKEGRDTARQHYTNTGNAKGWQDIEKEMADTDQKRALARSQGGDAVAKAMANSRMALDTVRTPEQYILWHEQNHTDPVLGEYLASRGISAADSRGKIMQAIQTPGGFEEMLKNSKLGSEKALENHFANIDSGGQVQTVAMPKYGSGAGQVVAGSQFKKTATPGELLTAETARRGQNMTNARSREANDGNSSSGFSDEAINNAAARYNMDGTLPPMGMGKGGSDARTKILNRAAEQASGISGSDQRSNQVNFKGDSAARNASVKSYSANGKEGMAIQATNTAMNHLDTIEKLAIAQKNGDTLAFNKIANYISEQTGQAAPTNLRAAISMVAPEVSKSVIGASGGQEERKTFAHNFNPNASAQQALEGIAVIKELMGGRLTESQRTYERTTGKKDFAETMLSPAAQNVLNKSKGKETAKPSLNDIFK